MSQNAIRLFIDPALNDDQLAELLETAWGSPPHQSFRRIRSRSLAYIGAYEGARLIGFVNVAWDGGVHAFILDTCVHPDLRRRGIATQMVTQAIAVARQRGARWLHVDFEPHLAALYRRCGFRHTDAGLIAL